MNARGYKVTFSDNSKPRAHIICKWHCFFYNDNKCFDFLMQHKPDLEFKSQLWSGSNWDTTGTALHVAVLRHKVDFAEKLIQNGA